MKRSTFIIAASAIAAAVRAISAPVGAAVASARGGAGVYARSLRGRCSSARGTARFRGYEAWELR